jgi:two-component system, response regulator PdtaR
MTLTTDDRAPHARVLVISSMPERLQALHRQITQDGHHAGSAPWGQPLEPLLSEHAPEVLVVDVPQPGPELIHPIPAVPLGIGLILLTDGDPTALLSFAEESGASALLPGSLPNAVLGIQIRLVRQRMRHLLQLRDERDELALALETRKLVERAKGILMKRLNIAEPDAHRRLQNESQNRRIPLGDVARKVIESDELLG